jgi:NTE family protein
MFQPVRDGSRLLVDGAISMEIPALLARQLGATHVISVYLPAADELDSPPANMFQVVNRSIQILQARTEESWRKDTDLTIAPIVSSVPWDGFTAAPQLLKAGEEAALAALPRIQSWFTGRRPVPAPGEALPSTITA